MRRPHYTVTADDVGKTHLRLFGRTHLLSGFMGRVLPNDVGKRIYDVDGVLQIENDEQRDRREGR